MNINTDIFKIESNNVLPSRGKLLISEPFLRDDMFGRSVILLIDYTSDGSMGLIMNKQAPILLNEVFKEFKYLEDIPVYNGGPLSTDTLFYLHTIPNIEGSLPVRKGLYMNGDFDVIKKYILQGNPIKGCIRFFLGYSGWGFEQLNDEIRQNTWIIGKSDIAGIMSEKIDGMWKKSLEMLGSKYETWSRFPQIPSLN
ncbi:YqgE/AlgH family protein [Bacteroides sp. 519]|uniref:YqgE/AlgH family protein n=1 Tax=Bacteroides sp. 519 TaxID=2302937 RepID=UPI0013D1B67E|nr:YqgE/AlgH family protein [Bacteroides sp. 519]NDV58848.1 YqgE/AlgH family protein [Bacteroides sp. 519]